jgi:hypothetical protein
VRISIMAQALGVSVVEMSCRSSAQQIEYPQIGAGFTV